MGTHLRELNESYPMNTNMIGLSERFASLCFVRNEPIKALEGLTEDQK